MAEAAASLQKERAEDEGKEAPDEAAAAGEGHVSGGPVEKQSFFGKIKTGFSESVKAAKRLQATYLPGTDLGDKEDEKEEERPQTATKTATSDEDGPVWEPGQEQLMWTDATYVVEKFKPGIHPNNNLHFVKPESWFNSAEDAIKMLEQERRGLKQASLDKQNLMSRTLLQTNRLISTRLRGANEAEKKQTKFRGGCEPIQHVLPPDVQRSLHSKLCKAVEKGEREVMEMLLRFDIDLDYSDPFGTPLHYAAFFGQLQAAHILLDKGAFPGALNYREETPLHVAARKNAETIVDLLVRYGAPINSTEIGGLTAMHIACELGFVGVVDKLIMGGGDCDRPNLIGWAPLHLASMGMHHNVIEKLCISGMAKPDARAGVTRNVIIGKGKSSSVFPVVAGDTPAHFAAKRGHFMCLKVLLENGAASSVQNSYGETIMHCAVANHDMRAVQRILEHGWDSIDLEDKDGRDPIDVCDDALSEHAGPDPDSARTRGVINEIKTVLQRTSVRKNQQAHRALMDQAKKGVGGRKKRDESPPPPLENDDTKIEIQEAAMDDRSMAEKIQAMNLEIVAARAEARASEAQSRAKTYDLNEALMETRRRLVEAEFMLERERESRLALEQDVLALIGTQEEGEVLKSGTGGLADMGDLPSRGGTAEGTMRVGTGDANLTGTYESGATYESMRLGTAISDSMGSRTQSTIWEEGRGGTGGRTRTPSGVRKLGRMFSGSMASVTFAETETFEYGQDDESTSFDFPEDAVDEENEVERETGSLPQVASAVATRQTSTTPGVLKQSRGYSGTSAQRSAHGEEIERRGSGDNSHVRFERD